MTDHPLKSRMEQLSKALFPKGLDLNIKKTPVSGFTTQAFDKLETAATGYIILGTGAALLFLFLIFTLLVVPLWGCIFPKPSRHIEETAVGLLGTRCTFRWSIFKSDAHEGNAFCINAPEFPWFLFYIGGFLFAATVVNYYENVKK